MFGWFTNKCPLETWEKTWTEFRMRWLAERLGLDRLLNAAVVLPTEEFFPDAYEGTEEDARRLLNRLGEIMKIPVAGIALEVYADEQMEGDDPTFKSSGSAKDAASGEGTSIKTVRLAASQAAEPFRLTAVLAHELGKELLVNGNILTPEIPDHEWIADLVTVYLGLGIFPANASLNEVYNAAALNEVYSDFATWGHWTLKKGGYLPARIFGYALALFAMMRGEENPEWSAYLRPDAASALQEGIQFLRESEDCLFHPNTFLENRSSPSVADLVEGLRRESPTMRLATLWEIRDLPRREPELLDAVMQCLQDPDPAIPGEAAQTLAEFGPEAGRATPHLVRQLGSRNASARAGAVRALGVLSFQDPDILPELGVLLEEGNPVVLSECCLALRRFGLAADFLAPRILAALQKSLIECDQPLIEILAETFLAVAKEPKQQVKDFFAQGDRELRSRAWEAIKERHREKPA